MPFDLSGLKPGEVIFVPALRVSRTIGEANRQATNMQIAVSYRVTVLDGKYGVLFTRQSSGRWGVRNEDTREV